MASVSSPLSVERDSSSVDKPRLLKRLADKLAAVFRRKVKIITVQTGESIIPEHFQSMSYMLLDTFFGISDDQVPGDIIQKIYSLSNAEEPTMQTFLDLFLDGSEEGELLLKLAVQNHIKGTNQVELSSNDLVTVVDDLKFQLKGKSSDDEINISQLLECNTTLVKHIQSHADRPDYSAIRHERSEAVKEMDDELLELFSHWEENPHALNDEVMSRYFKRHDHQIESVDRLENLFLSTYFDTAQFGLENELLTQAAADLGQLFMEHLEFVIDRKNRVLRHLEPIKYLNLKARLHHDHLPLRFTEPMHNLFVAKNGTEAFKLFCDAYIQPKNIVLTMPQEYPVFKAMLEKKAQVISLPDYDFAKGPRDFERRFKKVIKNRSIDYVLISDLSRHGTPYPLSFFRQLLDKYSPRADLIVDGAQSIGRRLIDFNTIRPSVFIGSIQKGSNAGFLGMLMLADEFIRREGLNQKCVDEGSLGPHDLARLVAACTPEAFGALSDLNDLSGEDLEKIPSKTRSALKDLLKNAIAQEDLRKMTLSVSEREKAIHSLTCKFAELLRAINQKCGNRIRVLCPKRLYQKDGSIRPETLSGILTLKIDGVSREALRGIAVKHGVTINDYHDEMKPGVSFRIAFHPFMNNDSLKILSRVLMEAAGYDFKQN